MKFNQVSALVEVDDIRSNTCPKQQNRFWCARGNRWPNYMPNLLIIKEYKSFQGISGSWVLTANQKTTAQVKQTNLRQAVLYPIL